MCATVFSWWLPHLDPTIVFSLSKCLNLICLLFESVLIGFFEEFFSQKNISNKSTFNHSQYRQFCTASKIFLWCAGYFCGVRLWDTGRCTGTWELDGGWRIMCWFPIERAISWYGFLHHEIFLLLNIQLVECHGCFLLLRYPEVERAWGDDPEDDWGWISDTVESQGLKLKWVLKWRLSVSSWTLVADNVLIVREKKYLVVQETEPRDVS